MTSSPAPRSALEQSALQAAAGPDWVIDLHPSAGSTNAIAADHPLRGLVVVADHQTAGRGRLDRVWETPAGAALTFSAVVDPQLEARWWPALPLMAGLAVARAIGGSAALKWPNDVLLEEQKVCGILVERLSTKPALAVIGIGINVDQRRTELPVAEATSLALCGLERDRTDLLGEVLSQLRHGLGMLLSSPHSVLADYRGRSATLDRQVQVSLPDGTTIEGRVHDIDDHGQLVIDRGQPQAPGVPGRPADTVTVGAGDVVHVRPRPMT